MGLDEFLGMLEQHGKVRCISRSKSQYMACCPAHGDTDPSLSVSVGQSGKILLNCHAGCSALDVVHSMGLQLHDLFEDDGYEPPHAFAKKQMAERKRRQATLQQAQTVVALGESDSQVETLTPMARYEAAQARDTLIREGVEADPNIVLMAVQGRYAK